jgi:hypothetical protein
MELSLIPGSIWSGPLKYTGYLCQVKLYHEKGMHENGMHEETTSKDRIMLRKQFAKNKYKEEYIYPNFLYLFTFLFNLPKTFFFN